MMNAETRNDNEKILFSARVNRGIKAELKRISKRTGYPVATVTNIALKKGAPQAETFLTHLNETINSPVEQPA